MFRVAALAFIFFLLGCGGSSGTPADRGGPSDAGGDAPGPSTMDSSVGGGSDGGAFGAQCDSEYTDGCSSIPGPGTAACGEDPTHCCQTRRGCSGGLTCVGATCSVECSSLADCKTISPTAVCVYVFSTSTLKGCFESCDGGGCRGGLVCRTTTPMTCEQYIM